MRIEHAILKHLIYDEDYTRKVIPFIKPEYFSDRNERAVYEEINSFVTKYNTTPTYESLVIQIGEKNLFDDDFKNCIAVLDEVNSTKEDLSKHDWLLDKTEKFCQDRAIYNGVVESVSILDGKNKALDKGAIPNILSEALAVSFDQSIGHDFIEDSVSRFDYYHRKEERIPFDLEYFNKITNGGLPKGTLNLLISGTNVGKTLTKCHFASHYLQIGKNVLYITLEMSEEEIGKRIDANLMNVSMDDLMNMSKEMFEKKIARINNNTVGKLIIKQYPTASASVVHFRNLLNELNLKKNFMPDIVIVDYMNICTSSRLKTNSNVNSYTLVKSIAEELRGLAVEFKVPILSSTQFNRGGGASSDPNMEDISESHGTSMTADWMVALISTEELDSLNQLMVKQIKSRYGDKNVNKRFVIGIDRAKMRLYDVESSAQQGITDSGQKEDKIGKAFNVPSPKFDKSKFNDFKV
jgi:replicative DNA helicase